MFLLSLLHLFIYDTVKSIICIIHFYNFVSYQRALFDICFHFISPYIQYQNRQIFLPIWTLKMFLTIFVYFFSTKPQNKNYGLSNISTSEALTNLSFFLQVKWTDIFPWLCKDTVERWLREKKKKKHFKK